MQEPRRESMTTNACRYFSLLFCFVMTDMTKVRKKLCNFISYERTILWIPAQSFLLPSVDMFFQINATFPLKGTHTATHSYQSGDGLWQGGISRDGVMAFILSLIPHQNASPTSMYRPLSPYRARAQSIRMFSLSLLFKATLKPPPREYLRYLGS